MRPLRLVSLAVAVVLNACSNGGGGKPDASLEGGSTDAGMDVKTPPDGGQTGDGGSDSGGPMVTLNPECTVPADAGSNGSCVVLTGDGGVECNPVTNAPCNTANGEACDRTKNGGYHCFPPPNTATVCMACDDLSTFCTETTTCVPVDGGTGACARFCCADGDCGPGHCDRTTLNTSPIGVCVQ